MVLKKPSILDAGTFPLGKREESVGAGVEWLLRVAITSGILRGITQGGC